LSRAGENKLIFKNIKHTERFFMRVIALFIVLAINVFAQFGPKNLVKIESYQSFDKVYAGGEFKIAVRLNIEEGWHINSNKPYDDFLIPVSLKINDENFKLTNVSFPLAKDLELGFSDKPLSVYEGEQYIGGLVKTNENIKTGTYPLIITVDYQACNDNSCLPPNSVTDTLVIEVTDSKTASAEINQEIFSKIKIDYSNIEDAGKQPNKENNVFTSTFEGGGLLLGLLLVFIGGLALNLTPCVYPLIPITVGYFGGQSEGNTRKLVMMGILFVLGMAVTYSIVGVVTALSGAVFGSLLQNTYVILFIVAVFIVLSLSMFGVYEFKLPDALVNKAGGAKSGLFGAFFMGLTMGIVAAPCIGPFVIGLVTYVAAKADPLFGFLLFFVLAIGLGMPYLVLAIFSGKIKKLPRAGEWMEAVKHIFGFILIGMALYFLLPLLPKNITGYILPAFMVITALYLLFVEKLANNIKGFRIFKIVFSVIILAVAVYAFIPAEKNSIEWKAYYESSVPANLAGSDGMIIDFYADWCIPCKELDAITFSDPKVIEASKNFHTFKADMTKSLSPEVETLRNKYNILGVPTVLIINSRGEEVHRITGFVDAEKFLELINNI
jgi:thiol:disulfide interchange protein DsbD